MTCCYFQRTGAFSVRKKRHNRRQLKMLWICHLKKQCCGTVDAVNYLTLNAPRNFNANQRQSTAKKLQKKSVEKEHLKISFFYGRVIFVMYSRYRVTDGHRRNKTKTQCVQHMAACTRVHWQFFFLNIHFLIVVVVSFSCVLRLLYMVMVCVMVKTSRDSLTRFFSTVTKFLFLFFCV